MKKIRINRTFQSILAIIVIVFLILTSIMYSFSFGEQRFKDIKNEYWGKKYIEDMVGKNILTGYEDSTFKPDASVSRVEAVVMVTRLFNKSDIDSIYASNKSKYEADLKKNNIPTWSYPQIVFALEKGVINKSLLPEFVKNGNQQDATRIEIAICLAKGLNIENEINTNPMLTFNDTKNIPKNAMPYVDVLIKKGIINGKGDYKGDFNPSNPVTRAEMAKMLSVGYELVNKTIPQPIPNPQPIPQPQPEAITTVEGKIYDATTYGDTTNITIVNSKDEKMVFSNKTNSISVKWGDETSSISNLKKDTEVILNAANTKVYSVKIKNTEIEKEGYLNSVTYNSNGYPTVTFKVNGSFEEYKLDNGIRVKLDGTDSNIYNLKKDDKVKFKLLNGKLTQVEAISQNGDIKGNIKSIDNSNITIEKDKNTYTYEIDKNADIERNDKSAKLSDIRIGDEVRLKLEYGKAKKIDADSVRTRIEGVVKEMKVSSAPEITIQLDNNDIKTYKLLSGFTVEIDGNGAGLFDLRVGYRVEITLESDVVSKIKGKQSSIYQTYIGVIKSSVNTSDKIIELENNSDGKTIYIKYDKKNTTILDIDGSTLDPDRLRRDDVINVIGEDKLGSINAKSIIRVKH